MNPGFLGSHCCDGLANVLSGKMLCLCIHAHCKRRMDKMRMDAKFLIKHHGIFEYVRTFVEQRFDIVTFR